MIFSNRSLTVSVVAVIAATALGLVGCSTDDGQPASSSGSNGTQTTGDKDASADDTGSATDSGAGAALGEDCADDGDCESDVCYHNDKGKSYCTLKCTTATAATVCGVAPFDGKCNGKGYCRLP